MHLRQAFKSREFFYAKGRPFFEKWFVYIAMTQIAIDSASNKYMHQIYNVELWKRIPLLACFLTLPNWAKNFINHPGKRSDPPTLKQEIAHLDMDKKVAQTIWASFYTLTQNMHCPLEQTPFQKGASLIRSLSCSRQIWSNPDSGWEIMVEEKASLCAKPETTRLDQISPAIFAQHSACGGTGAQAHLVSCRRAFSLTQVPCLQAPPSPMPSARCRQVLQFYELCC